MSPEQCLPPRVHPCWLNLSIQQFKCSPFGLFLLRARTKIGISLKGDLELAQISHFWAKMNFQKQKFLIIWNFFLTGKAKFLIPWKRERRGGQAPSCTP